MSYGCFFPTTPEPNARRECENAPKPNAKRIRGDMASAAIQATTRRRNARAASVAKI